MNPTMLALLVEDDQLTCKEIVEYIDMQDDISLVGVTNSASRAVEYIWDYRPDAVILDLELNMGSGNGLLVLQELNRLEFARRPYILITTNNTSAITYESARQMGADFIMSKHQTDYSSKSPVDFLRMMKNVIQSRLGDAIQANVTTESPEFCRKRKLSRISRELDLVGISPKAVGYQYLLTAIQIVMEKSVSSLCSVIGETYGKTEASVERAMQNAIAKAWRISNIDDLLRYYTARISSEKGVPTVTEFVYYYANKIKNEN